MRCSVYIRLIHYAVFGRVSNTLLKHNLLNVPHATYKLDIRHPTAPTVVRIVQVSIDLRAARECFLYNMDVCLAGLISRPE
jgi:hypothetical protein